MPDSGGMFYGPIIRPLPSVNQGKKKRLARQQRIEAKKSK